MTLHLYNSLSRRSEPLVTLEPGVVRMYVCGVTVYDEAHIGHAMSAVVFDVVRRYLEWQGYVVQHVVNFTDVDDKIITRARDLGRDPFDLTEQYIGEYLQQMERLNVLPATIYPRATTSMPAIIAFIERLIASEHAYVAAGDVYFRVARFPDYGKLSGRKLADMLAGARIAVDEAKESPADFALWKAAKPGEPAWDSPWGAGRPGWHIECSAMNLHHLGEQIDIHGGGSDLVFPHHENEIAQTESLTGREFARYWMHNGMLQLVDPASGQVEKMSKSLGNLVTIEQFLSTYDADVFRLLVLSGHYRRPLTYNDSIAADQHRAWQRLIGALDPATGTLTRGAAVAALAAAVDSASKGLVAAMDDDFNTSVALSHLFELVRAINVARAAGVDASWLGDAQATLKGLGHVLGLRLQPPTVTPHAAAPFIDMLVTLRGELRRAKQYALADTVRDDLAALGVTLEDTPQGTRWTYSPPEPQP